MNYIVFDLEWNQSAEGKECSVEHMPFEIIEIGAVKLNSQIKYNIIHVFILSNFFLIHSTILTSI